MKVKAATALRNFLQTKNGMQARNTAPESLDVEDVLTGKCEISCSTVCIEAGCKSPQPVQCIVSVWDHIFSCRMRLEQLCQRINNQEKHKGAMSSFTNKYVPCKEEKFYSIPLRCGKQHNGQTGKHVKHRLGKHYLEVSRSSADSSHLIVNHARTCADCVLCFKNIQVLGGPRNGLSREIIESFSMNTVDNVSAPSLVLS